MLKINIPAILFSFIIFLTGSAQAETTYSEVFIFGDSLSDTGNLASVTGDFPAPYYMNRVSNGAVAVETLVHKLGHTADASLHLLGLNSGDNYSVAGANAAGGEAIDLSTQILSFQANNGFTAPADALYVIFIGGNDVRSARDTADRQIAKSTIKSAVATVSESIEALAQIGARSFLLVNAPNIALIPETNLIATATDSPALLKKSRKLSNMYRVGLHKQAESLEETYDINIVEFDLFKFFNKLVKKADSYGFTNTTDACFSTLSLTFHPDCNYGMNADAFIFFDEIHPSSRMHEIIGEAFYDELTEENEDEDEDEEEED